MSELDKKMIFPDGLARPTGVWSTVTVARPGRMVFVSGLTAKNAAGVVVGKDDIRAQTIQVCENLKLAMASAGGTLGDIMRVDVYIKDMDHFKVIHEVRGQYFDQDPPASTMVAVSAFTHPDMLIEINAIAVLP